MHLTIKMKLALAFTLVIFMMCAVSVYGLYNLQQANASLDDAREKMEAWRRDYNEVRPHSAIGNKTPISLLKGSSAPPST